MARPLVLALMLVITAGAYVAIQNGRVRAAEEAAAAALGREGALAKELRLERGKERVITRYVDRVRVVREQADTIIKEVPIHVTPQADSRCDVPVGFVGVHDAAARNLPLDQPARNPDAPAAGVALSAVAATVTGNYGTCHEIREQLIALQAYVHSIQGSAVR